MSFQEKRAIVSLGSTTVVFGGYGFAALLRFNDVQPQGAEEFVFWGSVFFFLIPVAILVKILLHLAFVAVNKALVSESEPVVVDELDRLVESKATAASNAVFVLGFFLSMGWLALRFPPTLMFESLFTSAFLSSVARDIVQVSLYRKGFFDA